MRYNTSRGGGSQGEVDLEPKEVYYILPKSQKQAQDVKPTSFLTLNSNHHHHH
jgi:hypothetical protein